MGLIGVGVFGCVFHLVDPFVEDLVVDGVVSDYGEGCVVLHGWGVYYLVVGRAGDIGVCAGHLSELVSHFYKKYS